MANIYVPGPSPVAIGVAGGALQFLGWTQGGVTITEELRTVPIMTDYSGPQMPADIMLAGKTCVASFRLIDFNQSVLNYVFARYATGSIGRVKVDEIGTLLRAESGFFRFCVKASRRDLINAYSTNLGGCNFPFCFIQGPLEFPFGNMPQVIPVQVYTWAMVDKTGASDAVLWNDDTSGFPQTN